jgi:hypothetical protein
MRVYSLGPCAMEAGGGMLPRTGVCGCGCTGIENAWVAEAPDWCPMAGAGGGGGGAPGLPNIWVNPPGPEDAPEGAAAGVPKGAEAGGIAGGVLPGAGA